MIHNPFDGISRIFTAYFSALPPPLPSDFWAPFTAIVVVIIGSFPSPTIIGRGKARKQGDRLDYYKDEIKNLNDVERLDKSDIKKLNDDIKKLNGLRNNITDEYARGTINKEQYENLSNDILNSHREIFTKNIRRPSLIEDELQHILKDVLKQTGRQQWSEQETHTLKLFLSIRKLM